MSAAAVIALRRKKFIRRFAERGATAPDKAVAFSDLGMRRSWVFDQMVSRGVFVPVGSDRYYMDWLAAETFIAAHRRRALLVTMILLVVFLLVLVASALW